MAAAVLHDVIDDTSMTLSDIQGVAGPKVGGGGGACRAVGELCP